MKYTTRFFILFFVAVVLLTASLIAAAPYQTVTPPVTSTPVVLSVPPTADPIGSIVDQIGAFVIALLVAGVAWLIAEVRTLKQQGTELALKITPDNWQWLVENEAKILVKAARQLYPPDQTAKMLEYVQDALYKTLTANKILVTQDVRDKVRSIIEAAVFDLYAEFPEVKVKPAKITEVANSK